MSKKRLLVTGGSGFIGRNFVESEVATTYEIFAPRHTELELLDEVAVRDYLKRNKIEVILHSAAKPGHRNAKDPTGIFYANSRIFFNLARNRHDFEKMIVTGSGAVYDMRFYQPKMKEEYFDAHVPVDEHGMNKYVIEQFIQGCDNIYDLRIFGIYGKYEEYQIRFISNMICKALYDLPLTIKQDRFFDYLWVGDLPQVVAKIIDGKLPWHSINVTPDESRSLVEIAEIVLRKTGSTQKLQIAQSGMGSEYSGDNTRLRGFIPGMVFTSIENGVEQLVDWYKKNLHTIDVNSLKVDK